MRRAWTVIILDGEGSQVRSLSLSRLARVVAVVLGLGVAFGSFALGAWATWHLGGAPPPEPKAVVPAVAKSSTEPLAVDEPEPAPEPEAPQKPEEPLVPEGAPMSDLLSVTTPEREAPLELLPFVPDGEELRPVAASALGKIFECPEGAEVDAALVKVLLDISHHFDGAPVIVVSGHAAPSGEEEVPASHHTDGKAADVRVEGIANRRVRRAAWNLGARGLGDFPRSNYVHIDVGERRYQFGGEDAEEDAEDAEEDARRRRRRRARAAAEAEAEAAETAGGEAAPKEAPVSTESPEVGDAAD